MRSQSSDQTEQIGQKIGQTLKGGEIIELISDLGGGKTTMTRGIVQGMGSHDKVSSPTFTLNKEYNAGDLRVVHYDFYRLHEPGILEYELAESLNDPRVVTIIEWADIVQNVLPEERITVTISSIDDTTRQLQISAPVTLSYVTSALQPNEINTQSGENT